MDGVRVLNSVKTPAKSGSALARIRAVYQSRPCWSNIGLCTVVWLSQIASSPQMAEGCSGLGWPGVSGSRYGIFTCAVALWTGSSTGR